MAINDIYRLSVTNINRNSFEQLVNVFHYRQESLPGVGNTDVEDLLDAWRDKVLVPYAGPMSANTDVTKLEVRQITGGADVGEEFLVPVQPGAQGGDIMAQQTCPIVSWRTGQAGRSFRGRTYLPATSEVSLNAGFFIPSFILVVNDFANEAINLAASGVHGEWQLVIWSRVLSVGTPVTSFLARNVPATQRSRRIGVGS